MKISLSEEERKELEGWHYSETVPSAHAVRAKLVLSVSDGQSVSDAACVLGLSRKTAHKWLRRFCSGDPVWFRSISRRPHSSPRAITAEQETAVLSQAKQLLTWSSFALKG